MQFYDKPDLFADEYMDLSIKDCKKFNDIPPNVEKWPDVGFLGHRYPGHKMCQFRSADFSFFPSIRDYFEYAMR